MKPNSWLEECDDVSKLTHIMTDPQTSYEGFGHSDAMVEKVIEGDNRYHCDVYSRLMKWTDDQKPTCDDVSKCDSEHLTLSSC